MVGGGIATLALIAYALFSWLMAPAALIALVTNRRKGEAAAFALAIGAVWFARDAMSDIGPIHEASWRLFGMAILAWALMMAHFVIPIGLFVRVLDLEREVSWLLAGRPFGWLLVADGVVVWFLTTKRWLVPAGTETWLLVGAIVVTVSGLAILDRTQPHAT